MSGGTRLLSRRNAIALALVGALLMSGQAASATERGTDQDPALGASSTPGGGTGGDVSTGLPPGPQTPAEIAKVVEAEAYWLHTYGTTSSASRAILADARSLGISSRVSARVGELNRVPMTTVSGEVTAMAPRAAAAYPLSSFVTLTQVPQSKGYYCGPAVGVMILGTSRFGNMRSGYDGSAVSQTAVANANHMATDLNGKTAWATKRFVTGMNRWVGAAFNYEQINAPSAATFQSTTVYNINLGYAIAADTVEVVNGPHYNGHPNRLIGHWLAGYGYSNYANTVWFADSTAGSTAVSGYVSAAKFSATTSTFVTTYLQSNGIAV